MSWSVSGLVEDGNTEALEKSFAALKENNTYGSANLGVTVDEQFEFACSVVNEAFEAGVVEGAYSVSLSGHSNPEQENDRKSLNLSFSPVSAEYVASLNKQPTETAYPTHESPDAVEVSE